MKKFIVVGAGFRGFCDAIQLAKIPDSDVTIIDPAPFFGGLMNSFEIGGFAVDKGVHVFDSIPKDLADVIAEIMEGQVHEIDFVSKSAFNNKITDGFSLPDLNSLEDEGIKNQIETELIELAQSGDRVKEVSLKETLLNRYGKTAGGIFCEIFKKVYNIEASEVEPNAIAQTSLGRLKFRSDEEMLKLKSTHKFLDSILAARRKSMGKIDNFVSVYPSDGKAMKGWCVRAHNWLNKKGIKVLLGERIENISESLNLMSVKTNRRTLEAERVVWSNDNVDELIRATGLSCSSSRGFQYGTPMLFMTMMTEMNNILDFTYLQNFDPEAITYRTSSAGIYSHQKIDGISFVTSECPVTIDSDRWNNQEQSIKEAWNEIKELGIISESAKLTSSHVVRIPATFKLAKIGYTDKVNEIVEELSHKTKKVYLRDVVPFFRRDIYLDSLNLRDRIS